MLNKMFEKMQELDWTFEIPEIEEGTEVEFDIENYSPEGENLVETICFDGTPEGLIKELIKHTESFDVDDHVELWISGRGKNGVPNTVRELVEDAEAIQEKLNDLYEAVKEVYDSQGKEDE
jgi:hypothetical protein